MSRRRVVITGFGAVSPLGPTAQALWDGLLAGRSGLDFISTFDTTHFPIKVAGEVRSVPAQPGRFGSRTYQLLELAAGEASRHAGLEGISPRTRLGLFCGRSGDWPGPTEVPGPAADAQSATRRLATQRFGAAAALLADMAGTSARATTTQVLDGACASGGMAVGEAYRHIRTGRIEVALAGGTSSWTNLLGITAYHKLTALSTEARVPGAASRPFDARRSGFVMAEGAGVLVLEDLQHARARGAVPVAEVTGYAATLSAYRITDLPPDGAPQLHAMQAALRDAGRAPEDVEYINAHGTSTYQNDLVETRAISALLGERRGDVPVSSNKSMLGHTITAAGALEAIATACTVQRGAIPPTLNLIHADPDCDLDYVPQIARYRAVRVALSNSFGFGGQNCTLVIETFSEEGAQHCV